MALGIVLPVQLAMVAARTLGTYVHGRALQRGTLGTLFEQSFDVFTVIFLAVASGVTRLYNGGAVMWTALAAAMSALALPAISPSILLIRWLTASCATETSTPQNRIGAVLRSLSELKHSGLLNVGLAHRLVMLSVLRFAIVVLMTGQTAEAIGAHIPLWHFAAAVPFVVIASVIALTPGGLVSCI